MTKGEIERLQFDNNELRQALRPFAETWDRVLPQNFDAHGLLAEYALASIVYHKTKTKRETQNSCRAYIIGAVADTLENLPRMYG